MTDPDLADRTYIEPLSASWVERVIEAERPDALLPTMGGQTALNIAMELEERGVLEKYGVELIGANAHSIRMAEDREKFTEAMQRIGLSVPHGGFARTMEEALTIVEDTGYPAIIRPSFTMGGTGGGIAYNLAEFEAQVRKGLDASPIKEVLIDRSVIGWREYELEVVRDGADNVIIVCSIENFDPMGVHTGGLHHRSPGPDPHRRGIPADEGRSHRHHPGDRRGSRGVQHPVRRQSHRRRTPGGGDESPGFPVVGPGLQGHGLPHRPGWSQAGRGLPPPRTSQRHHQDHAGFLRAVLDYVVVKLPRFAFEKFPEVDPTLGVQMKAVGETMAIGRTFRSAWQKGFRGLEIDRHGWVTGSRLKDDGLKADDPESLLAAMRRPTAERPFQLKRAMEAGISQEEIFEATRIDPWFLDQLLQIVEREVWYRGLDEVGPEELRLMKREGFGDRQLADLRGETEKEVRERRWSLGIRPTYNVVDTCAGEFPAATPYFYSSYEEENESTPSDGEKIIILGSGPNRIGQGSSSTTAASRRSWG